MGIIFAAVLLFFVALSVLWSVFVRKLVKTRIKSICKIVCLVLAIIGTVAIKNFVLDQAFIKDTLLPLVSSELPAETMDLINASPLLLEVGVGLPVALITPIIFVILYAVFAILAGIVYMFILLFAGRKLKRSAKNDVPYAKARSIAWSACSAILALVVILLPIAFYGSLADDAMSVLAETDVMDAETQKMVDDITKEYVDPITKGTVVEMFRAFGGDMIIDEMTSFPLKGETVYVKNEFGAIADLAGDIMPLVTAEGGSESFGDKEADALVAAVNSLTKSKFLTAIASEAVYIFTDDMVNGEEPMVMADNEMFGDLITRTVTIVHDDAKDTKLFAADLKTVAEMASALIKGGVLANMDDTDALMDELAGGETIKNVIVVLGKNGSMKCLIPSVTNIGIEAIANAVEVKEDANEVYAELMNTIADDLNSVKDLDDENKVKELSPKLTEAFDKAGIAIDKQVIDLYSVAMIQGIINEAGEEKITNADVEGFFVAYAASANQIGTPALADGDESANSAPAVLARLIYNLSALDVKSEDFNEDLEDLLNTEAQALLGTKGGELYKKVVDVKLKRNLDSMFVDSAEEPKYDYAIQKKFYSTSTFANTVALQSAATMKEKSLLIFMDEIVIDVDEAAKLITDQTVEQEAEAIGGIFSKAGSLMNDVSGDEINIGTMAGSVGGILNSLNGSVSVGEERTTNLFIAIIQSSMVRDAANMDIGTATQLGVKGTVKNADGTPVDYEKTFKTISNTMDVLEKMNSSTDDDLQNSLTTVLKDLNPQTAGMVETYITEERLSQDYGLDEEQSSTAAPIISDVFGYMGSADMTEDECKKEADAISDVMNLVTGASDRAAAGETTGQTVFGDDPNTSIIGKNAVDTVGTFMASESIKHSLNNNSDKLEEDPFGMGDMMVQNDEKDEKQELEDAMQYYYETTEYETEEEKAADKETLTNLGKLFGFTQEEMDFILGE